MIEDKNYYFHSGGSGFILSNKCLEKLYPLLNAKLVDDWVIMCNKNNDYVLIGACDVSISYYLQNFTDVIIEKIVDLSFIHCNYKEFPCHQNQIIINNIISCHLMSLNDFDEYNNILILNNYFL